MCEAISWNLRKKEGEEEKELRQKWPQKTSGVWDIEVNNDQSVYFFPYNPISKVRKDSLL